MRYYAVWQPALLLNRKSQPESGRDKIVWSVRFRRARRTSVRRAAKSGAEKAKTFNFMQESERIPDTWARGEIKKMQKRRKSSRRRTCVRQRRFSAVEKADNHYFGEIR